MALIVVSREADIRVFTVEIFMNHSLLYMHAVNGSINMYDDIHILCMNSIVNNGLFAEMYRVSFLYIGSEI